ncbi:MAG: hypothetical protein EAZ27_12985 [Cytophagales bacterium]|nr:MAG: hypothetical protein EAZ27_12985 [Cytophagales bacterium]
MIFISNNRNNSTFYTDKPLILNPGTPKNLSSVEALPLGFCGFVAEIGLGAGFKNNIGVFRGSL